MVWSSGFHYYSAITLTHDDVRRGESPPAGGQAVLRRTGHTTYEGLLEHTYDPPQAENRIKITRTYTGDHTIQDRDYNPLGRRIPWMAIRGHPVSPSILLLLSAEKKVAPFHPGKSLN